MQPYCAFREIFEIRAVGALHGHTHLTHVTPDTTERILETVRTSSIDIPDLDLVANCLGMRLSYGDFISSDPLYNTILDIALFCINWNTPSAVTAYLDKIQTQNRLLICSFFTGRTLKEGEYEFPEERVIDKDDFFVFDSRLFIPAKLDCLYFLMPRTDWKIYVNEFLTSETYYIKSKEKELLR
ncbi:unnamed protein product [Arctia plantaginis]|uniref:Uncharacterized protein n=1 Tax=Arctia plantaginis TaxID=874455 RepID=A0A8S0YS88_ARCPL|nr:unnamed protein product [Arctia plantaginis]